MPEIKIDEVTGKTYAELNGVRISQYEAEELYLRANGIPKDFINYGTPETGV